MSKITTAILLIVVAGIVTATYLGLPYFSSGFAVVIVGGLAYCFFVTKRDAQLLNLSLKEKEDSAQEGRISRVTSVRRRMKNEKADAL